MAEARSFINSRTQTFDSLRANLALPKNTNAKFLALNSHISGSVVLAGELVIVGDASTSSSTAQEAFLMAKAAEVHTALLANGAGGDDFFLENFELLKQLISHSSMGVGAISESWGRHLEAIKATLQDIERMYREYLGSGTMTNRDEFYAKRTSLFIKLEQQLDNIASLGSGLRNEGSIKRLLGLSTTSYLHTGEVAGYAEKVSGVARAAKWMKSGTYIGIALDVSATGLSIHKACAAGREEQCRKAKYVEGASLVGSLGGSAVGGSLGSYAAGAVCMAVGLPSAGVGTLACVVVGAAAGGALGGALIGSGGEFVGEYIYGKTTQ